jgi:hypothetical protein
MFLLEISLNNTHSVFAQTRWRFIMAANLLDSSHLPEN